MEAIIEYMNHRGKDPRHFFVDSEGKVITKARFVTKLRDYLKAAGMASGSYSSGQNKLDVFYNAVAVTRCENYSSAYRSAPFYRT